MKITQFVELAKGLEFLKQPTDPSIELKGLCGVDKPRPFHLCLVKGKDFAKKLRVSTADFSQTGLLIDEKLKSDELLQSLKSKETAFVGFAPATHLLMAALSKPFYQQEFAEDNDLLDSRTDLSSDIHGSAKIAQGVFIGQNCTIEENVTIYPGVVVMSGTKIGKNTVIYPNVTLYPRVEIGANCRIHAGTVIGADGFGYEYHEGQHHKIWHVGGVKIGQGVEIGANSCVDCGVFEPTLIGDGCILDNHVQIGHNVTLGRLVVVCGHTAISGSARIGDGVVFAGKSGIGPNMELGPGCQVAGGALVNRDWPAGTKLGGHPARELDQWMKGLAYLRKMSLKK